MFFRMVYKSGQIFLPFCQGSRVWRTDRRTDGRTDGQTEFSSLYRVCITCSAVIKGAVTCTRLRHLWLHICSFILVLLCIIWRVLYVCVLLCCICGVINKKFLPSRIGACELRLWLGRTLISVQRVDFCTTCSLIIALCHRRGWMSVKLDLPPVRNMYQYRWKLPLQVQTRFCRRRNYL